MDSDGGERRICPVGNASVVKSDNGDVLRDAKTDFTKSSDNLNGYDIVLTYKSGWQLFHFFPLVEQCGVDLSRLVRNGVCVDSEVVSVNEMKFTKSLMVAASSFCQCVDVCTRGDVSDVAVTELKKMLNRKIYSVFVVYAYRGKICCVVVAVDCHKHKTRGNEIFIHPFADLVALDDDADAFVNIYASLDATAALRVDMNDLNIKAELSCLNFTALEDVSIKT